MQKVISTDKAPGAIGPYSQAILANGFLYTSGQIPLNPETGAIEGQTIEVQLQQDLYFPFKGRYTDRNFGDGCRRLRPQFNGTTEILVETFYYGNPYSSQQVHA